MTKHLYNKFDSYNKVPHNKKHNWPVRVLFDRMQNVRCNKKKVDGMTHNKGHDLDLNPQLLSISYSC